MTSWKMHDAINQVTELQEIMSIQASICYFLII